MDKTVLSFAPPSSARRLNRISSEDVESQVARAEHHRRLRHEGGEDERSLSYDDARERERGNAVPTKISRVSKMPANCELPHLASPRMSACSRIAFKSHKRNVSLSLVRSLTRFRSQFIPLVLSFFLSWRAKCLPGYPLQSYSTSRGSLRTSPRPHQPPTSNKTI